MNKNNLKQTYLSCLRIDLRFDVLNISSNFNKNKMLIQYIFSSVSDIKPHLLVNLITN